ncbi:hypothetical protein [uncultured Dialister sp.]|uniref:hypothetical protein n=1 Tax=uncultured Dialister sp. TaxID=278064 RepID=UPI0025DF3494|nr:hypothetical protein [uncultured Dialister sp.]
MNKSSGASLMVRRLLHGFRILLPRGSNDYTRRDVCRIIELPVMLSPLVIPVVLALPAVEIGYLHNFEVMNLSVNKEK